VPLKDAAFAGGNDNIHAAAWVAFELLFFCTLKLKDSPRNQRWGCFMLWFLLFLVGTCVILLVPFLAGLEFYDKYHGSRAVTCPENQQPVAVGLDALHAAATGLVGSPKLRIVECTRWPEHADCGQECLPEAGRVLPYTRYEVTLTPEKRIYHLPVLIAAFFAWTLGAIWHSHYLFRSEWMAAVGLNGAQLHQLLWQFAPHLVTFGAALLFAYGVAWLLAWTQRKGIWRGIGAAAGLWALVVASSLASTGLATLSLQLLKIELSYTCMASVLMGAIIGGAFGKKAG
jgi:hypothetical protein